MASSGHAGLGSSGKSAASSSSKGIMVVASNLAVMKASSAMGNLLILPSILVGSLSLVVDEGFSSSSPMRGIVSVHLAFGDGQDPSGDVS